MLSTDEAAEVHSDDETDGEIVMVSTGLHSSDGLELRLQAGTTLGEATCWTEKGALPVAAAGGSAVSAGSSRPGSGGCAWFAVPVPPPCALYGSHEGDMVVFCAAASSEGNASARSGGVTSHRTLSWTAAAAAGRSVRACGAVHSGAGGGVEEYHSRRSNNRSTAQRRVEAEACWRADGRRDFSHRLFANQHETRGKLDPSNRDRR